jgi:hypothetical protein
MIDLDWTQMEGQEKEEISHFICRIFPKIFIERIEIGLNTIYW